MAVQITSSQIKTGNIITSLIANDAINADKLDQSANYTFTGAITVPTPTADGHAVRKSYVDALISGLHWKDSARVKTAAAITGTYNNGSSGVGATLTNGSNGAIQIDGVNLTLNDRVLVTKQADSDKEQNGIYKVTTVGTASTAFVLTRTEDADTVAGLTNAALFVREGSTSADSAYVQSADNISAIGTSDITFVQFSGGGQLVGGSGILVSGNTISVDLATNSGLELPGGKLQISLDGGSLVTGAGGTKVADGGIGSIQLAANAVTSAKIDSNAVDSSKLAANAVTSAKVADGAISTSAKLADNVVTAAKLANNAVASASLADGSVTAIKLNTSVAGDALGLNSGNNALEVKVDDASIEVSGDALRIKATGIQTGMLANGAVTDGKLANNAVGADKIASNAVVTAKLAANSVTAAKLNNDIAGDGLGLNSGTNALEVKVDDASIELNGDALRLKAGGVDSAILANNAVSTDKIAGNAVTSAKIADGAINTSQKLGDGVVSTNKLAGASVTSAKLAANSVDQGKIAFAPQFEAFAGNGSATFFDLGAAIAAAHDTAVKVFRNGLRMKLVSSSPSGQDEYTVAPTGGAGGVCRIQFGSAPSNGDEIYVDSLQ